MKYPELQFSAERVKGVLRTLKDFLRSWKSPFVAEEFKSLADDPFAEAKAQVDAAKKVADSNPKSAAAEAQLALAVALNRDLRYSHAGRVHLARLAWNTRVRGGFEGARTAKDNNFK